VGLSLGSALAGISAGIAALFILLNFGSSVTVLFIVGTGLPALLIVRQALISQPGSEPNTRDWYPPGQILAWLTGYGLLVLGTIVLFFALSGASLETVSRNYLQEIFAQFTEMSKSDSLSDADQALVTNRLELTARLLAPLLAGYWISFHLLLLIAIATLTQRILNRAGLAHRPTPSYITMELPQWLSVAMAVAIIALILPGTFSILGQNTLMILSIPFILLGLTVIHTLSRRNPNPQMVLAAVYFALFLLSALFNLSLPILALLMILGIVEQWASLRRRLTAPGANQEDE
jgi:hypothetical protein